VITPGGQPFLLPGGPFGCLLIHSFASSPQELRWLGTQLNQNGFTVLAIRLSGHATNYKDLRRTRYSDWIASMEDGLNLLQKQCDKLFVVGASLGSALALIAGAKHPVDALVAISPPYNLKNYVKGLGLNLPNPILKILKLGKRSFRPSSTSPVLLSPDERYDLLYPSIPNRVFSEIDQMLTEMIRVLPNVDVPSLIIHTDAENEPQRMGATQILDDLNTKRVKILRISRSGDRTTLPLERERLTRAITSFVTKLPGFQQ
jgi:carboxylesterase